MAFVHLHTHSEYSLLDGANRIDDLVTHVQRLGMDSLAVTDHGNLHAAWSFYAAAKAKGLRPILGFEAYLAYGDRHSTQKPPDAPRDYSHLVLLARNREGYRNLIRLSSIGFVEGFYRRPRIDKEYLAQHREGLIGLSGCLASEVPILAGAGKGVMLIKLADDDRVIGAKVLVADDDELVVASSMGGTREISKKRYEVVGRAGKGFEILKKGTLERVIYGEPTLPGFPAPTEGEDD